MSAGVWRLVLGLAAATPLWGAAHTFPSPGLIRYDARCLTIEGLDVFVCSAAVNWSGLDRAGWRQRLEAIKAGGFNTVTIAATDPGDLGEWLHLAHEEFGLYTILQLPSATSAAAVAAIAREQVTRRGRGPGGTILLQISDTAEIESNYLRLVGSGIEVPLFGLGVPRLRDSDDPALGQIFDALSFAPSAPFGLRVTQLTALQSAQPDAPVMVDQTVPPASPSLELAEALNAIEQGATILSFAWPDSAQPEAIRLNRLLARAGPELARSHPLTVQAQTGSPDVTLVVRRARNGATYLFLANHSGTVGKRGRASLWLDRDGVEFGVDYVLPAWTAKVMRLPPNSTDAEAMEQLLGD